MNNISDIPSARPEDVGMDGDRLSRINDRMAAHIDQGNIQGAVTAVARGGRVVHFEAHGEKDTRDNTPMREDALFRMASSTKPVLGVATMMMIEEGLIRPSNPVTRFIPEFKDMQVAVLKEPEDKDISPNFFQPGQEAPAHRLVPANQEITIHHLLTHTSGLMSNGLGTAHTANTKERLAADATLASYIPRLGDVALDFQPGSRWRYSPGTGLDVVARIIEIVSGMDFDTFVRVHIFEPLRMNDTHFNVPDEKSDRRVAIKGREKLFEGRGPTKYFSASGGLTSTCRDFLHFEQMFAGGGSLFGERLLSPRTIAMMTANQTGDLFKGLYGAQQGMGFGYTVSVVLDPVAADSRRGKGAFGWGGAFGTQSWTDPGDDVTAVLMLQQPHQGAQYDFGNAVQQAIIE